MVRVREGGDFLIPTAPIFPRTVTGTAFLSPVDALIFERERAHALFGLHYRIGIYTPGAKRTRGYYSLPSSTTAPSPPGLIFLLIANL